MNDRVDEANITQDEDEQVLNTDTITQATSLARKVLHALASDCRNEDSSFANKIKKNRLLSLEAGGDGGIQFPPPNNTPTIPVSAASSALTNLNQPKTVPSGNSDQLWELLRSSRADDVSIVTNDNDLDCKRSFDDVNMALGDACNLSQLNEKLGFHDESETVQVGTNTCAIENPVWNSLRGLDTDRGMRGGQAGKGGYSPPTSETITNAGHEFLQHMVPKDALFHHTDANLTVNVEKDSSKKHSSKPWTMDLKSTRDRRRAIARQRTLVKRRAEEQFRMRKMLNDLSRLSEAERVRKLTEIKEEALRREERKKEEQRRVSSREAVQRCRGKAGSTKQELESNLKQLRNENEKLKEILTALAQCGCITIEEFRKCGVIVRDAMGPGYSLIIEVCPRYLQADGEHGD